MNAKFKVGDVIVITTARMLPTTLFKPPDKYINKVCLVIDGPMTSGTSCDYRLRPFIQDEKLDFTGLWTEDVLELYKEE